MLIIFFCGYNLLGRNNESGCTDRKFILIGILKRSFFIEKKTIVNRGIVLYVEK